MRSDVEATRQLLKGEASPEEPAAKKVLGATWSEVSRCDWGGLRS